jgi:hypothetical protein
MSLMGTGFTGDCGANPDRSPIGVPVRRWLIAATIVPQ